MAVEKHGGDPNMIPIFDNPFDDEAIKICLLVDPKPKEEPAGAIALTFVRLHNAQNYRHITGHRRVRK